MYTCLINSQKLILIEVRERARTFLDLIKRSFNKILNPENIEPMKKITGATRSKALMASLVPFSPLLSRAPNDAPFSNSTKKFEFELNAKMFGAVFSTP